MSNTVISVEHLSKTYRLGQIGTGTFSRDLEVWWAKVRGKPNPLLRIGEKDHGNRDGEELYALRDVSFTVQQGEVLGIIGRNGAGKSTLLKILSRVTAPTSGRIKVKGRIASLLEVGTGFHPELTGRENIYLNGAILGMSKQEVTRKFDEIVDFAEIEKFIDTPVKRYSSGMYVRLAFAVAAHLEPEILVVDEVLAVGDVEFQKKCIGKMGDVAQAGRAVLFVSHNMTAIEKLCSHAIRLDSGDIVDTGSSVNVISRYVSSVKTVQLEPLKSRNERLGAKDVIFTGVKLKLKDDVETDMLICGQMAKIELTYEASKRTQNLGRISVSITFVNIDGNPVTCLWDRLIGATLQGLSPSGKLICHIPKISLMPGKYTLNLVLTNNGVLMDKITNAHEVIVAEGDFFNSGFLPPAQVAVMLMEHSWAHN